MGTFGFIGQKCQLRKLKVSNLDHYLFRHFQTKRLFRKRFSYSKILKINAIFGRTNYAIIAHFQKNCLHLDELVNWRRLDLPPGQSCQLKPKVSNFDQYQDIFRNFFYSRDCGKFS